MENLFNRTNQSEILYNNNNHQNIQQGNQPKLNTRSLYSCTYNNKAVRISHVMQNMNDINKDLSVIRKNFNDLVGRVDALRRNLTEIIDNDGFN